MSQKIQSNDNSVLLHIDHYKTKKSNVLCCRCAKPRNMSYYIGIRKIPGSRTTWGNACFTNQLSLCDDCLETETKNFEQLATSMRRYTNERNHISVPESLTEDATYFDI